MKCSLVLLVTLVTFNLDLTKSKPHHPTKVHGHDHDHDHDEHGHDHGVPAGVSWPYFNAFSSFVQRQVSAPSYVSSVLGQSPRVTGVSSNPFNLGSLYSVLSEQVFEVECQDLRKTLDIPEKEKAINVYGAIQDYLNKDDHTVAESALFTSTAVPLSEGLSKYVHHNKNVGPFENSTKIAEMINSFVANHTNNLIVDQLLPTKDAPFYSSTSAVLVNTLSAHYHFKTPFTPGPNMEFRVSPEEALSVETLEVASVLKYHEGRETVVVIPMENSQKRLILIKPDNFEEFTRKYLDNFVQYLNTISSHPLLKIQYFKERNVHVQVPVLNLKLASRFTQEYEGQRKRSVEHGTSAICDTATDHKYFLQTPVQVSTTRLSAKAVDLAVAIGVQIDNVAEYRKIFGSVSSANNTGDSNSNSFISITEAPAARFDLAVEPEPVAEAEPLADEAVTEIVVAPAETPKPKPDSKVKTESYVKPNPGAVSVPQNQSQSSSPVEVNVVPVAEPEPEPEPLADSAAEPKPFSVKSVSKLRSDLDLLKMGINKEAEQLIPVKVHSPLSSEDTMLFSRALNDQVTPESQNQTQNQTESAVTETVPIVKSGAADDEGEAGQINVVFDSPFYMGIFDEAIGIYSFLAVRSPFAPPVNAPSQSNDFSEYEKLKRWVCLAPPAPPALVAPTTF